MNSWIEWFGTLASVIVALSLTMRNIKRLRILNLVGSLAFAAYGFRIAAWPVFGLNVFIVVVNAWYLYRMAVDAKNEETFDVLFVDPVTNEYARRFLSFYATDIARYFPSFNPDPVKGTITGAEACFILRETLPVSLVVFRRTATGEIVMLLDYAIPAYRDLKNARFFFEKAAKKIAPLSAVFSAAAEERVHASYLRKMGFQEVGRSGNATHFRKTVGHEAEQGSVKAGR
jgi:hypothetical protein